MEEVQNEAIKNRKDKIINWLKNPYVIIFILIILLAVILRIIVFSQTTAQGLWWDEAEYMAKAKYIAYGHDWVDFWNPHKPILLSLIAVPFFLSGIGEIGIRILVLLLSIAGVILIYFPVKEFFNSKKLGLFASFMLAIYWVHLFFTGRLLVELPATTFFFVFWYFFIKGVIKKENPKYIWLAGFFFGIAFMFRVVYGVIAIPIIIYVLFEEKFSILKNKHVWIGILFMLLAISPMIIFLVSEYPDDPIGEFLGFKHNRFSESAGAMEFSGFLVYFLDLPYGLGGQSLTAKWIFTSLFIFGSLIYFSDIIFAFDKIFVSKKLRLKLFVLIFILFLFLIWGYTRAYVEERDYLPLTIFFFGISGLGFFKIQDIFSKYNKTIVAIIMFGLLFIGAYYNISWGFQLTEAKAISPYNSIKEAGLWIKQNSQEGDIVYSTARKQMLYYTEREVLDPGMRDYGNFENAEKPLEEMIQELETNKNIKYIEMDIVEKRQASESLYFWIQNNSALVEPVIAWYADAQKTQTVAVIYRFKDR